MIHPELFKPTVYKKKPSLYDQEVDYAALNEREAQQQSSANREMNVYDKLNAEKKKSSTSSSFFNAEAWFDKLKI